MSAAQQSAPLGSSSPSSSSSSSSLSQSSDHMPEDPSFQIYSCKWAWCRSTFWTAEALVHHVIHEHARRSIPIRRRDIAMTRRVGEGSGESLKFSYYTKETDVSNSAGSSQKLKHQESVVSQTEGQTEGPHLSLPSPPNSSPALRTPPSLSPENEQLPGTLPSSVLGNDRQRSSSVAAVLNPTKISLKAVSELQASQQDIANTMNSTPTFASLGSPADSLGSQPILDSIPNSPSFSSLVERPNKRKPTFEVPENASPRKVRISRSRSLSQSDPSSSQNSNVSQMSVEKQLTQNSASDSDTDGEDNLFQHDSPSKRATVSQKSVEASEPYKAQENHEEDLYGAELSWDSSRAQQSQKYTNSESGTQENSPAKFDLLTEPPSQLQLGVFPFHKHKNSTHAEPSSSASFQLNASVRVASPTFAASTPQSWYQPPPLRRKHSNKPADALAGDEEAAKTSDSPSKSQTPLRDLRHSRTPKSKHGKAKSMFRSGTMKIAPMSLKSPSNSEEVSRAGSQALVSHDRRTEESYGPAESQSQSFMDFSQSLDELSYPIQTQAPYESQPTTQF